MRKVPQHVKICLLLQKLNIAPAVAKRLSSCLLSANLCHHQSRSPKRVLLCCAVVSCAALLV
jgi:hypothetical protein